MQIVIPKKTCQWRHLQMQSTVSSEIAHPGYLKNLVAARWNRFQRYFLYRVIEYSCRVELPACSRRSLTSESEEESRTSTDFRLLYFRCHCPVECGDVISWASSPWTTCSSDRLCITCKMPSFQKTKPPTILAKMCGTLCLFPKLLQYSLAPPFPPMQCWTTLRQAFPYEGKVRKVEVGQKNVCFNVKNWSMVEAVRSPSLSHIILARIVAL